MLDALKALISNEPFMSGLISWTIAALIKGIIEGISTGNFDWERFLGTGGMPSTHTTPIVAVCASIGFCEGFDTPLFALALALTIVVAHDAAGVRRHAGEQAKAINNLIKDLTKLAPYQGQKLPDFFKRWNIKELKTLLGHNPLEVLAGIVLGIVVSSIIHFQFGYLFY